MAQLLQRALQLSTGPLDGYKMASLADATRQLFEVFASYPLKPALYVCPDCGLEEAEQFLHKRALAELRWRDFGVYPFKAMTTFGDVADFKHFLPRIFELYVEDHEGSRYSVAVVLGKLEYAAWREWPTHEVEAVEEFLALWRAAIQRLPEEEGENWRLDELREGLDEISVLLPDAV